MTQKYFGDWATWEDMQREFESAVAPDEQVLVAEYTYEDYSGQAWVLYETPDGSLYEVHGGHCSCYGLEGQWEPEKTSWPEIAARKHRNVETTGAIERLAALTAERVS